MQRPSIDGARKSGGPIPGPISPSAGNRTWHDLTADHTLEKSADERPSSMAPATAPPDADDRVDLRALAAGMRTPGVDWNRKLADGSELLRITWPLAAELGQGKCRFLAEAMARIPWAVAARFFRAWSRIHVREITTEVTGIVDGTTVSVVCHVVPPAQGEMWAESVVEETRVAIRRALAEVDSPPAPAVSQEATHSDRDYRKDAIRSLDALSKLKTPLELSGGSLLTGTQTLTPTALPILQRQNVPIEDGGEHLGRLEGFHTNPPRVYIRETRCDGYPRLLEFRFRSDDELKLLLLSRVHDSEVCYQARFARCSLTGTLATGGHEFIKVWEHPQTKLNWLDKAWPSIDLDA